MNCWIRQAFTVALQSAQTLFDAALYAADFKDGKLFVALLLSEST